MTPERRIAVPEDFDSERFAFVMKGAASASEVTPPDRVADPVATLNRAIV